MKFIIAALLFACVNSKHEIYKGWKTYNVVTSTTEQVLAINEMVPDFDLDILSHPNVHREGLILVKPEHQADLTSALDNNGIEYSVSIEDMKRNLDYNDVLIEKWRAKLRTRNGSKLFPYDDYQEIEVIYEYIEDIAKRYPEVVTLVRPGTSFEGRPIMYLKISTTKFEDLKKPVIFIDGCIHAREWITPPVVIWAISKLVENVTEPDLLRSFDWILLPVINPDGYKYTFEHDRLWRKTRSTDQHQDSKRCPGVDANRNFDFHWGTVGTSSNPCSIIYSGNRSFSEPETRVIRDIYKEHIKRIALYINMHSYGSMILYPWGHDGTASPNEANLHKVGEEIAKAIDAVSLPEFQRYRVGNGANILQPVSGTAKDYAHSIGIPLTYTHELPGFKGGFILDPKYIRQVCYETWEGIVAGARMTIALLNK